MRTFTVEGINNIKNFIEVSMEPYPHIGLGEKGRGRVYGMFPVVEECIKKIPSRSIYVKDLNMVENISIIRTRNKGTLLGVPERNPGDTRCLVLSKISGGYRGGLSVRLLGNPHFVTKTCSKDNGEVFTRYCGENCDYCGGKLVAVDREKDLFKHPVGYEFEVANFTEWREGQIVCEGYCAQGAAGRMGGWPEYLMLLEPGDTIRYSASGRLYGGDGILYLYWDGRNLKCNTYNVLFPPQEQLNIHDGDEL